MFKRSFPAARLATFALLLLASSLLAACGDQTVGGQAPATAPTATTAAINISAKVVVTLKEYSIDPKIINVAAGHIKIKVVNAGTFPHNFGVMVNGKDMKSPDVDPGGNVIFELDLTPGTYNTLCDLPTHKDKGMAGTIVVKLGYHVRLSTQRSGRAPLAPTSTHHCHRQRRVGYDACR
jgi:plastocyanin